MGVAERREREREQLRSDIVDAARDLLLEQGLGALSMRAIAERIEYSPATIYLYFRDKEELVRAVVQAGFERLSELMAAELAKLGETATAAEQYGATGRAYARFGVEHPAYFRVMFELPSSAQVECPGDGRSEWGAFDQVVCLVEQAVARGEIQTPDAARVAVTGWGLIHGLTTLYLTGHLGGVATTPVEFYELVEDAMGWMNRGWSPRAGSGEAA